MVPCCWLASSASRFATVVGARLALTRRSKRACVVSLGTVLEASAFNCVCTHVLRVFQSAYAALLGVTLSKSAWLMRSGSIIDVVRAWSYWLHRLRKYACCHASSKGLG